MPFILGAQCKRPPESRKRDSKPCKRDTDSHKRDADSHKRHPLSAKGIMAAYGACPSFHVD